MVIGVTGARPNSGPNIQALGWKSVGQVFGFLSLVKVDGKPIVPPEILNDPKQTAQAITAYFQKNYGVSPQKIPHLATAIKRALKNGDVDWRG